VHDLLQAGSPSTMKSSSRILASQKVTLLASAAQSALPLLPTRLVTKHTPLPLCPKVPRMHSLHCLESRVHTILHKWRSSQGGSGEGMETNIKCEDGNEALCLTPKQKCFYKFRHILSILIYSSGIWLDCSCVMCILNTGPSIGQNPVTSSGIG